MNALKLGKKPATLDKRDLLFSDFKAAATLEQAPVGFGVERAARIHWQMLGNGPDNTVQPGFQGAGDCVCADACNRVIYSNSIAGKPVPPFTGLTAIKLYETVGHYKLDDPATDNGTDMRTALNYARTHGITDAAGATHKIGGYCALQAGNWTELLQALNIFDVVSIGIQFPASAMGQFDAGKPWTYVKSSAIEGGHDVLVTTRPTSTHIGVQTWAKTQPMAETFYTHLSDEAYGVFLPETLVAGKSPEGFNLTDFTAALAEL